MLTETPQEERLAHLEEKLDLLLNGSVYMRHCPGRTGGLSLTVFVQGESLQLPPIITP